MNPVERRIRRELKYLPQQRSVGEHPITITENDAYSILQIIENYEKMKKEDE